MYNGGAVGDQAIDFMDQSSSRLMRESREDLNAHEGTMANINSKDNQINFY